MTGSDAYEYNVTDPKQLIGKGAYGYVFRAIRKRDQENFAIKVSKDTLALLSERERQDQLEEIKLMKKYSHPLIVEVIDEFVDLGGHQCIV
jgi:serine/threonine protein kinase